MYYESLSPCYALCQQVYPMVAKSKNFNKITNKLLYFLQY